MFFRLIRWPNLLIVAITQYLLQYLVLVPALEEAGLSPILGPLHFFLLVLDTVLIAAGGYIINDVIDYETDLTNKPDRVFIHTFISKNAAIGLYAVLSLIGLGIAWYLAGFVGEKLLVLIYPTAVGLLWLYSRYFKKMPLTGNVVVAVFCAFVAGVVLFAERDAFQIISNSQPGLAGKISLLFGGYVLFAFLSTMLREIVKDLEDLKGDRAQGVRSLPIVFGIKTAKGWAMAFVVLLLAALLFFSKWLFENTQWAGLAFTWIAVLLPLVYTLFLLKNATEKSDFTRLSKLTKFIMLAGLILLLLIWKF
jgi:4-hydroxybenzoate polyprenyltransferase